MILPSLAALVLLVPAFIAQHEHHGSMAAMASMTSSLFPGLPMSREGSGTSWLPDAAPVHARHFTLGSWNLMVHGNAALRYTSQDASRSGSRGGDKLDAPNWIMIMAQPPRGKRGGFGLRGMFSLDRLTEGGAGYPLLFQSGETWRGEPLVDRQHPHDLFSELSISYGVSLGSSAGAFVYLGFPGEPALGPPAFMHRPSSLSNPDAPLGHHQQDSSHITFGVLTAGAIYKNFKLDASVFTGREPDEDRFGFDRPRFDSFSARLSFNPSTNLSFQVSHGFLRSPEAAEPETDIRRTTASLIMSRPIGAKGSWTTTLLWGANSAPERPTAHSVLLDSEAMFGRMSAYARLDFVQRSSDDLGMDNLGEGLYPVFAMTAGASRRIANTPTLGIHAGGQISLYRFANELAGVYGRRPFSFEVYIRVTPSLAFATARGGQGTI